MKNGGKIGILVMLALTVALAGLGAFGLISSIQDRNAQPTDYELYKEETEQILVQGEAYMDAADQAIESIGKFQEQIVKNRDALANASADALTAALPQPEEGQTVQTDAAAVRDALLAKIDEAVAEVDKAAAAAPAARDKMSGHFDKIKEMTGLDGSDEAAVKDARDKMPKRLNMMRTALKTITKIDKDESASNLSAESIARKQNESAVQLISEAFPGLDLGEQYTVIRDAGETVDNVKVPKSFRDFCMENWDYFFWLAGVAALAAALMAVKARKPETFRKVMDGSKKNMMLVALVFITLIFFSMTRYKLLSPVNVSNIINQNAYIIILACGMLLCIISSANIDLSVGRVMGFIAACAAKFMIEGKMPVYMAVPLCLLIGVAIGAWQGFWIAYMKIPAFVVTLAGQLTFYGLTMMILQGLTINNFPTAFNTLFNAYLPDFVGSALGLNIGINVTTMLIGVLVVVVFIILQLTGRANRIKKGYPVDTVGAMWAKIIIISVVLLWLFYSMAAAFGLPTVLFTVAIVLLIYLFITSRTVVGRHLYAMGGNVNAARLSGVKTQKMLFLAYVNMGLLAALAGLVYAARLNAASPQAGQGDELYAIASCYIGGASAYGGIGTVGGALIGAMTMGVIKNGMSIMSLGQDVQQIVLGMVLLTAVVIDVVSKSNGTVLPFLSHFGAKKDKSLR